MSRCKACNKKLNDQELVRKLQPIQKNSYIHYNEYTDLCTNCLKQSDLSMFKVIDRCPNYEISLEDE